MLIARNVLTVGSATLLSRILGFIWHIAFAALFGAGARADAFFVAYQFVSLVRRLVTEGALNAALIPLYLRRRRAEGDQAAAAFVGRLLGSVTGALITTAGLLAFVMPALILLLAPGFGAEGPRLNSAVEMGRLMLPYLALAGPLAILMGVLQANNRFGIAALAVVLFNTVMLTSLLSILVLGIVDDAAGRMLATTVGLSGLCQLTLVAIAVWTGPERVTPIGISRGPEIGGFIKLAIPGLVASGIPQITTIAGVMVASTSESAVSWIYYAHRLIELPLGIVGIAIGIVLVPAFTRAVQSGDRDALVLAESRGLEIALGLALPAAIALALLAEPIMRVLFERGAFTSADTRASAAALSAFALGLPGHVLVKAFSPAFFAREDTATPMRAALLGLVIAIVGSVALMPVLGHVGIALAIALSGWSSAAMLWIIIRRRIGFSLDQTARRNLPLIAVAAAVMGIVLAVAQLAFTSAIHVDPSILSRMAALGALILIGLGAYAGLLHVLGVTQLTALIANLRRGA